MSSSKRQALIMTGIGFILLSLVVLYFTLSMPKVSGESTTQVSSIYTDTTIANEYSSSIYVYSSTTKSTTVTQATTSYATTDSVDVEDVSFPININTCTAEELTAVSGIGESRASAIIQYREYLGSYTSVEQIKNIKGFGDKLYEKVAPYLTV